MRIESPERARLRVDVVVGIVLLGVVLLPLAGCTLPRRLPERAAPQVYATLDHCALVSEAELKADHPVATVRPTVSVPLTCSVQLPDLGGALMVETLDDPLPNEVLQVDGERVRTESLLGGRVIDVGRPGREDACRSYVIADNGVWLKVFSHSTATSGPRPQLCEVIGRVARTALRRLVGGVTPLVWPETSLFRKDMCGALQRSGVLAELGITSAVRASASRLNCFVSGPRTGEPSVISMNADVLTSDLSAGDRRGRSTIAGRPAVTVSGKPDASNACSVQVDFGPNAELARQFPGRDYREGVQIAVAGRAANGCQDGGAVVTALVEALA